ncbi:diguanylate cyclase [bacterium]|nr:diguanylate cyclase [bacterium]
MDELRFYATSILFFSCAAIIFVCALAWNRKSTTGLPAVFLTLCGLGVAIYDFGYAMEIHATTLATSFFWVRFEHWGIQLIPPLWLMFTLSIMGKWKKAPPLQVTLLLFLPTVLLICSQTLGSLNLLHPNARLATGEALSLFEYDRGLPIYLSTALQSVFLAVSFILFTIGFVRGGPVPRIQTALYWFGSNIPWVGSIIYNSGSAPYNIDVTPFLMSVSIAFFMIGFLKVGILDIAPVARTVVFEDMKDGVLVIDRRGRITDFNPGMGSILPSLVATKLGANARETLSPYDKLLDILARTPPAMIDFKSSDQPGAPFYHVASAALRDKSGKDIGMLLTFHDMSEMKDLQRRLEVMATHDDLTGLYNRRYLNQYAAAAIEEAKAFGCEFSIIMVDLDHFKRVNDTFGHTTGDEALKAVSEILRQTMNGEDCVVGRFGGEELLAILPRTDAVAARTIAENARTAIAGQRIPCEGVNLSITASFGVSSLTPVCDTLKSC